MSEIEWPHIKLLIKGTSAEVEAALATRGFDTLDRVSPIREFIPAGMGPSHTMCHVLVQLECEARVMSWFDETEADPQGYTVGALLTYFKRPATGVPILPMAHSNGSGKENLLRDRLEALNPLRRSLEALCAMRPHGRDYYVTDGALRQARDHHEKRIEAVRWVIAELHREALLIDGWK